MKEIEFVYFDGCPNAEAICSMLIELKVDFEKIEQNSLPKGSKFKNYSSPTVMVDGEIIFGSRAEGGGCSLNIPTIEFFEEKLR